jgi:RNA polymerase sigma-70 factor (ECF subfamily)
MVKVRMDPALAPRFDPSDVVQEALLEADAELDEYVLVRPVAFYPWLRQIAWERLLRLRDEHLKAQKRSVMREATAQLGLSQESVTCLVGRLADNLPTPSEQMVRSELRRRIQEGLASLRPRDREILELLYLEQLKTGEVADVLEISAGNVRARHLRALQRLARTLQNDGS